MTFSFDDKDTSLLRKRSFYGKSPIKPNAVYAEAKDIIDKNI